MYSGGVFLGCVLRLTPRGQGGDTRIIFMQIDALHIIVRGSFGDAAGAGIFWDKHIVVVKNRGAYFSTSQIWSHQDRVSRTPS